LKYRPEFCSGLAISQVLGFAERSRVGCSDPKKSSEFTQKTRKRQNRRYAGEKDPFIPDLSIPPRALTVKHEDKGLALFLTRVGLSLGLIRLRAESGADAILQKMLSENRPPLGVGKRDGRAPVLFHSIAELPSPHWLLLLDKLFHLLRGLELQELQQ
jgi:hypothetical protein